LKILAALVDVTLTKSDGDRKPWLTALVHVTAILSSTPLTPFGIKAKLSPPNFYLVLLQKVQLSVATV